MSGRLRRLTRNPLGSARRDSNPLAVDHLLLHQLPTTKDCAQVMTESRASATSNASNKKSKALSKKGNTPWLLPQAAWGQWTLYGTWTKKFTRGGTRTRNLLLRREAPYPLGHTSTCLTMLAGPHPADPPRRRNKMEHGTEVMVKQRKEPSSHRLRACARASSIRTVCQCYLSTIRYIPAG